MPYQILDWDTNFFGVSVARIDRPDLNEQELAELLLALKAKGVQLVYWPSSRQLEEEAINRLNGRLVDTKTTFAMDLRAINFEESVSTDIVEPYAPPMPIGDIEELALQSGTYSRFVMDPKIPREQFVALYHIWIRRSLKREIAEEVLVIQQDQRVVGMVTLGNKLGRGDIGLIAVDGNHRGQKYGETLVRAAQRWFVEHGYELGQVVTQGANIPACQLYQKCGYVVEKEEYFYHFWL